VNITLYGVHRTNYAEEDEKHGLYFLREPLECEQVGVSVIDVEDGREGPVHDHSDDNYSSYWTSITPDRTTAVRSACT